MTDEPLRLTADPETAGSRLDRFLADHVGSRARAQGLIDGGAVTVDGRRVAKRHTVAAGETIEVGAVAAAPVAVEAEPAPFAVAWEDEHLLVVDKPAGVVVHPARGHRSGTLVQALAGRAAGGGDPGRPGIVHRLDRDTSGLLVVESSSIPRGDIAAGRSSRRSRAGPPAAGIRAGRGSSTGSTATRRDCSSSRSDEVHRALGEQLAARELRREYRALVDGHPQARTGTIEAPIGRDRRDRLLMSIDTDDPREARTHFELERLLPTAALLGVVLDTGRTHQIRVHLAAIGIPVAGDPQYGTAGSFGLDRQFLHAARLAFTHPVTGEPIDVRSELPEDLVRALRAAESAQ